MSTYLDEIHLVEGVIAPGSLDIKDGDDVFMVEVAEKLHLSESTETEHGMIKGGDLLDGHLLSGWLVYRRAERWLISSRGRPSSWGSM